MRSVLVLPLALSLLGCGGEAAYKGDRRYAVQGTVKYNDQPVSSGMISFIGETGDNAKQFATGGPILDGKYSIESNKGPNAGKYQVIVRWSKPTGKKRKDSDTGEMIDEVKEVIPKKYNEVTELRAEIGGGSNTFDFDLKGPAVP